MDSASLVGTIEFIGGAASHTRDLSSFDLDVPVVGKVNVPVNYLA